MKRARAVNKMFAFKIVFYKFKIGFTPALVLRAGSEGVFSYVLCIFVLFLKKRVDRTHSFLFIGRDD